MAVSKGRRCELQVGGEWGVRSITSMKRNREKGDHTAYQGSHCITLESLERALESKRLRFLERSAFPPELGQGLYALFSGEEGGGLVLLCARVGYAGGSQMRCVIAVLVTIFVPAARPLDLTAVDAIVTGASLPPRVLLIFLYVDLTVTATLRPKNLTLS